MKTFDLLDSVENIFAVEIAKLDLGDIFCLNFVDRESVHQIRNDVLFLFGLTNDADGLVDIKQKLAESHKKMKLCLLFLQIKG